MEVPKVEGFLYSVEFRDIINRGSPIVNDGSCQDPGAVFSLALWASRNYFRRCFRIHDPKRQF
jgi:hypothetical protein